MKRIFLLVVLMGIGLICIVNLYSSSGERTPETPTSTTTITYNIPYFNNQSGSYIIDIGLSKTNTSEVIIRIIDDKGRLITTISPSILDKQIEKMKELASRLEGRDKSYLHRVEGVSKYSRRPRKHFKIQTGYWRHWLNSRIPVVIQRAIPSRVYPGLIHSMKTGM